MKHLFGIIAFTLMISLLHAADSSFTTADSAQTEAVAPVGADTPATQQITIPEVLDSVLEVAQEHWYTIPSKGSSPEKWTAWGLAGALLLLGLIKWIIGLGKNKNLDVPFSGRH
jgi:hypothetical protein